MTPVATTTWLGERNGSRFEIVLAIGKPYRCSPEEWACPVELRGLHDSLRDIHGGDALQALCLALRLAFRLLAAFRDEGGKILHRDGDDVPLETYLLGVA